MTPKLQIGIKPMAEQDKDKKTEQQKVMEDAVRQLERLGGATFREDDVIFEGKQLVVPESMTIEQAIQFLKEKADELTVETDFSRKFSFRPWDVAYCAWNVMRETFGAVGHRDSTIQTFFGPMKAPPRLIDIQVSATETLSVPWGNFVLPHLPEVTFSIESIRDDEMGMLGFMTANGPKRWRYAVHGVFELVERELKKNSLYRGKAFDGKSNPTFLDLSMIDPEKMVYSRDVLMQLEASLWSAIKHRRAVQEMGVPFKRAVLLSGDFGVGKSMAINRTGQIAEQEGVTFILVRPGRDDLREALVTAKMYQPAVVAFEDVDTVADVNKDSETISEVLDLFDGVEAKNSEIMLVLTTNHVEKLHKGMLRPGRLDAIIAIGPPDAEGIQRLIEVNIGHKLEDGIEWEAVAESMQGYLPAFVVESAHRALRYALVRNNGFLNGAKLNTDDLVFAGNGLRTQYDLMQEAKESVTKPTLDTALREAISETLADTSTQVEELHDLIM